MYFSTEDVLNDLNLKYLRIPVLKSIEIDNNNDGISDEIDFQILMPIGSNEYIYKINILLFCDVKFKDPVKYTFDGISYISSSSSSPIGNILIEGDILLRQSWPLIARGG